MSRTWTAIAGASLALALSACGSSAPSGPTAAQKHAAASASASAKAAAVAARHRRAQRARHDACASIAGPLLQSLQQLESRLTVGLQFSDYTSRVGDARVAYDAAARKFHVKAATKRQCIDAVGIPLQNALNAYTSAETTWNDCIQNYACSFAKGSTALVKTQGQWSKSSAAIQRAQAGLNRMKP